MIPHQTHSKAGTELKRPFQYHYYVVLCKEANVLAWVWHSTYRVVAIWAPWMPPCLGLGCQTTWYNVGRRVGKKCQLLAEPSCELPWISDGLAWVNALLILNYKAPSSKYMMLCLASHSVSQAFFFLQTPFFPSTIKERCLIFTVPAAPRRAFLFFVGALCYLDVHFFFYPMLRLKFASHLCLSNAIASVWCVYSAQFW